MELYQFRIQQQLSQSLSLFLFKFLFSVNLWKLIRLQFIKWHLLWSIITTRLIFGQFEHCLGTHVIFLAGK
jgi:hypothetical protein